MKFRFLALALAALVLTGIFALVSPQAPTLAEAALVQEMPRLDGVNIYFTESAKEASRFDRLDTGISRFAGLLRLLGANLYTLEWRTGFPTDADLIIIAGPIDDLSPDQIARLWSYLNNNGRLLLLSEPMVAPVRALPFNSGLFQLMWSDMGLRARNDVAVIEASQRPVSAESTEEPVSADTAGLIADFVTGNLNTEHPVTADLDGELAFFGARSLEFDASLQGFDLAPLIFTDSGYYGESAFADYLAEGAAQFNIGTDTTRGPLALAAAFNNESTGSRMVVIGDRDFATNSGGFLTSPPNTASFVYPDNVRFMLNAVTWLLDAEAISLSFPTPGPTATATITPSPTPTATPEAEPTATPSS